MAADWPSYQHDNRRTGVTAEQLDNTNLALGWVFASKSRPQPAWRGKMERDSYAKKSFLADTYDYDKAFNLIAADGRVYFGSSSGNACVALNAADGAEVWRVPAGGAVRVAPAYHNGLVYFGSDDGMVYCVSAFDGALQWKYRGGASDTLIASDHKFLSRQPCRTGVLVQNGSAYCGFGLPSWHGNIMSQLDAITGAEQNKASVSGGGYSFEGMLLADGTNLYVTQGRNAPAAFLLSNVSVLGKLPGCGGTYATISTSGEMFHGPGHRGSRADHIQESNASTRAGVTTHPFMNRVLVNGSDRYALVRDVVQASGGQTWVQGLEKPVTMIMGGTTLYVGARKQVVAIDSTSGTVLKTFAVEGDAYSLAIADGRLFVSTTVGKIYCFK